MKEGLQHDMNLLTRELYDTMPDEVGKIVDASWYLHTDDGNTYRLVAMSTSHYNAWYMESTIDEDNDPETPPPLVIPDEYLGTEGGLIGHVESEYLDLSHPERVNRVAKYLLTVA